MRRLSVFFGISYKGLVHLGVWVSDRIPMFLNVQLSIRGTERVLERDFDPFTLSGLLCVCVFLVSSAVKQSAYDITWIPPKSSVVN